MSYKLSPEAFGKIRGLKGCACALRLRPRERGLSLKRWPHGFEGF
jgi:hypothetical protein